MNPATDYPIGRVTLMFTDVQGSTAAWERHDSVFGDALRLHEEVVEQAIRAHGGRLVKTAGDGYMVAFASAADGVRAAVAIQAGLARVPLSGSWEVVGGLRVRIGLHSGTPTFRNDDYFGPVVNRAARIADAAHGGMILVSEETRADAAPDLAGGVHLKDHGYHRLKDLGQPVRLYEVRAESFRDLWCDLPLRTLESRQHNFPQQVTSLVGRQRERDDLNALLSNPTTRLITLTGPGGSGKTRLAMQVAADRLQNYPDGVWLIDLSAIRDPSAVPAAIAHALGVPMDAASTPEPALLNHLRKRQSLLVLDNFEQVAEAAPIIARLLRECASITCLVTSREVLRLSGERDYPVDPLTTPPPGATQVDWSSYESVQLFLERCQAVRPDFQITDSVGPVIGEICRRLDGIPLAVELAAARTRVISPSQILQKLTQRFDILSTRLRDVPERQQTLRSTIDWSYELLSEEERQLLGEAAVFQGGFFLEDAEAVCTSQDAMELVFSLCDKSLLKTTEVLGQARYFMLETIREYAHQKLIGTPSLSRLRDRHSARFLAKAHGWCDKLATADADDADQLFRIDLDNVRSGMDWVATSHQPELTMEFGKALFPYLRRHGLCDEADIRLTIAEDAAREVGNDVVAARLLNQRGLLAMERGDLELAAELYGESLYLSDRLGDRARVLVASINLGTTHWLRGDYDDASRLWTVALELARTTEQPRYEAFILDNLGSIACRAGRFDEAVQYYDQSLRMHRANENTEGVATVIYNAAEVSYLQKKYAAALAQVRESQALYVSMDHKRGMALGHVRAGLLLAKMGRLTDARKEVEEGLQLAAVSLNRHAEAIGERVLGEIAARDGDVTNARVHFSRAFGLAQRIGDRKLRADIARESARIWRIMNEPGPAATLLRFAKNEYLAMSTAEYAETAMEAEEILSSVSPAERMEIDTGSGRLQVEEMLSSGE